MMDRILSASKTKRVVWPDADYVLLWNGNERIIGVRNNPVNASGYARGLLPTIYTSTPQTLVPKVSPFLDLSMSLVSGDDPNATDELVQYLSLPDSALAAAPDHSGSDGRDIDRLQVLAIDLDNVTLDKGKHPSSSSFKQEKQPRSHKSLEFMTQNFDRF
jgi:hypothetical protein